MSSTGVGHRKPLSLPFPSVLPNSVYFSFLQVWFPFLVFRFSLPLQSSSWLSLPWVLPLFSFVISLVYTSCRSQKAVFSPPFLPPSLPPTLLSPIFQSSSLVSGSLWMLSPNANLWLVPISSLFCLEWFIYWLIVYVCVCICVCVCVGGGVRVCASLQATSLIDDNGCCDDVN